MLAPLCEGLLWALEDVAAVRHGTVARLMCWQETAAGVLWARAVTLLLLLWKACMPALGPQRRVNLSKGR